jgi:hypothetical protein
MGFFRRHRRNLAGGTWVVVLLAAAASVFWYRATYNVLPGHAASTRVHWCGRDYERAGRTSSWAQRTARESGPVQLAGRYPPLGSRAALYAVVIPASQRAPGDPTCATAVYLPSGPDRYRPYVLEGGP